MGRKWHIMIDRRTRQIHMIRRHFNSLKSCSITTKLKAEYREEFIQIIMEQCNHLLDELMNGYEVTFKHGFPIFLAGRLQ